MNIAIEISRRIADEHNRTGTRPTSVRVTTDEYDALCALCASIPRFDALPGDEGHFDGCTLEVHDE